MAHHGQGLSLALEAGDDLARVHAELDDHDGDDSADGLFLARAVDDAEAAFACHVERNVGANSLR